MYFNTLTKTVVSKVITKAIGPDVKLPKDERERIDFLLDLARKWKVTPEDTEDYIRVNSLVLSTIWWSNQDYEGALQIEALTNILDEYKNNDKVADYTIPGVGIIDCQQMLIRNYIESRNYSDALIANELSRYRVMLGEGEELAACDELINYLGMKGDFSFLDQATEDMLSLPKGEHSDCYACIINRLIRQYLLIEKWENASVLIDRVFQNKLTCDHIPNRTHIQKLLVQSYLDISFAPNTSNEKKVLRCLAAKDSEIFEATFLLKYALRAKRPDLGKAVLQRFDSVVGSCSFPEKAWYYKAAFKLENNEYYRKLGIECAREFDERNKNTFYQSLFSNG